MKFLIDNALSSLLAAALRNAGHDAVHVNDYRMGDAADFEVLARALSEERVLISADADFGALLAITNQPGPSVVLFRHGAERRPDRQVRLLIDHLSEIDGDLRSGAIVVFEEARIRIRRLPLR